MSRALALAACAVCSFGAAAQGTDTSIVLSSEDRARLAGRLEEDRTLRGPVFPSPYERSLEVRVSGFFDSDALYNDLVLGLRRGGFISREVRERSRDALEDGNRFGQELAAYVTFTGADSLFGRARWRPTIAAAYHNVLGVRFTEDAYALAFFGNAAYEEDTAVLAPAAHEQQVYQTLGFGIADAWTTSFLRIDLVGGRYLNTSDLEEATLFTGADGRVIDATVDGRYLRSDTSASGFGTMTGIGLSLNGRWLAPFITMGMQCHFFTELQDFGFVRWANALALRKDSTVTYEGLVVESIFDVPDIVLGEEGILDTLGVHPERRTIVHGLPFKVIMGVHLKWNERWTTDVTLDQRDIPGYELHAEALVAWRFGRRMMIDAGISNGGFGGPRLGLGVTAEAGDHFRIHLRSANVIGSVSEQARGMAASLAIGYDW